MAKKDYTHPHLLEIKTLAKQLQSDAKQSGSNLVYGHALDLASVQYGYKDWNTACGMLNSTPIVKAQPLEEIVNTQKKIFYVKSNPLMSEHQNIIDSPNSEAVPEEYCGSIESISAYVRERGGSLFFPTNSVADLKNLSDEQKEKMEPNIGIKMLLSRTGQIASYDFTTNHDGPFVIGRPGVGQSVYIEDLIRGVQEENPSMTEEEAVRYVHEKYNIQTVLDTGKSFSTFSDSEEATAVNDADSREAFFHAMATKARKYSGRHTYTGKTFIQDINNKHKKKSYQK